MITKERIQEYTQKAIDFIKPYGGAVYVSTPRFVNGEYGVPTIYMIISDDLVAQIGRKFIDQNIEPEDFEMTVTSIDLMGEDFDMTEGPDFKRVF